MILKQSVWHKKGIWFLIIFFVAIMKSMMKLIFIYVYGWIGLLLRIALSRDDKIKNTIVMSIRDMITQYFLCHDIIAAKIVAMPVIILRMYILYIPDSVPKNVMKGKKAIKHINNFSSMRLLIYYYYWCDKNRVSLKIVK